MEDTNQDVNKNGTIPLSEGSQLWSSLEINATTPLKILFLTTDFSVKPCGKTTATCWKRHTVHIVVIFAVSSDL